MTKNCLLLLQLNSPNFAYKICFLIVLFELSILPSKLILHSLISEVPIAFKKASHCQQTLVTPKHGTSSIHKPRMPNASNIWTISMKQVKSDNFQYGAWKYTNCWQQIAYLTTKNLQKIPLLIHIIIAEKHWVCLLLLQSRTHWK